MIGFSIKLLEWEDLLALSCIDKPLQIIWSEIFQFPRETVLELTGYHLILIQNITKSRISSDLNDGRKSAIKILLMQLLDSEVEQECVLGSNLHISIAK